MNNRTNVRMFIGGCLAAVLGLGMIWGVRWMIVSLGLNAKQAFWLGWLLGGVVIFKTTMIFRDACETREAKGKA